MVDGGVAFLRTKVCQGKCQGLSQANQLVFRYSDAEIPGRDTEIQKLNVLAGIPKTVWPAHPGRKVLVVVLSSSCCRKPLLSACPGHVIAFQFKVIHSAALPKTTQDNFKTPPHPKTLVRSCRFGSHMSPCILGKIENFTCHYRSLGMDKEKSTSRTIKLSKVL